MPPSPAELESSEPRLIAVEQRLGEVRQLIQRLRDPCFWRSTDGQITLSSLTEADRDIIATRILSSLDDVDLITAFLRKAFSHQTPTEREP